MAQPFWIRVVFTAAAVAFPVILPAQTCFGGKALPACHTFVVVEAGYGRAVTKVDPGNADYLIGDLGVMRNVGAHSAIGATFYVAGAPGTDPLHEGVKFRVRHWLGRNAGIDFGAGPVLFKRWRDDFTGDGEFINTRRTSAIGLAAHLEATYRDQFSGLLALEVRPRDYGEPVALYAGARLGSKPGLYAGLAVAVLAAIFSGVSLGPTW